MPTIGKQNKVIFSEDEINYIKANFYGKTNQQLADHLGVKLGTLRHLLYKMKLKRIELEFWTEEQVVYLRKHYKKMGDTEIAQYFNVHFKKNKTWTKRHIEKKRKHLNLKRSKYIIKKIHQRNVQVLGSGKKGSLKAWQTKGQNSISTIVNWKGKPWIKTTHGYKQHARYVWETQHDCKLSSKANVYHKDGDVYNCDIDNLFIVMNSEQGFVNRKQPEQREQYLAQKVLEKYNNSEVIIDGKPTLLKVKKVREKTALFYNNRTSVLTPSELPEFITKIQRQ